MSENVNVLRNELKTVISGQRDIQRESRENSASIRSMESSISKLANTVTEFVVESRHTRKDVDELRNDIHGKGEILDRLGHVETVNAVRVGRKELLWRWLVPVGSFLSGAALIFLGVIMNKGP